MLDQAFDALKKYDWGVDPKVLKPIDEAVIKTHGDAAARKDLESKLAALLDSGASRDAKDYVCRKLMVIGTAASVPALAKLLADKDNSHMARFALERNPAPEAAAALRDALSKVAATLKVGIIGSLGARGDAASVKDLSALVSNGDAAVARAAALALGNIASADAARAVADAKPAHEDANAAVIDARLACAEALLAAGKKAEAVALYKSLAGENQPKHVRLAATRGMLATAGKKE
jgi:HEAT repeat protein